MSTPEDADSGIRDNSESGGGKTTEGGEGEWGDANVATNGTPEPGKEYGPGDNMDGVSGIRGSGAAIQQHFR